MARDDNVLSSDDLVDMFNADGQTQSFIDALLKNPNAVDPAVKALPSAFMGHKRRMVRRKGNRTLMKNIVKADLYNNGASGYNVTADITTTDALVGTTALQITTSAFGTDHYLLPATPLAVPVDVRNGQIIFRFKPISNIGSSNSTGLHFFDVQLFSAGTVDAPAADYHQLPTIDPGNLKSQATNQTGTGIWQSYMIPVGDMVSVGSGADLTSIKYARIRIRSLAAGANITVMQLGPLQFVPNPLAKAKCIWTFDDGFAIPKQIALLNEFGFPGVLHPGASFVTIDSRASGRIGPKGMQNLHDFLGWQIGSQAPQSEVAADFDALTDDQIIALYSKLQALWNSLGLTGFEDGSYFSNVTHTNIRMMSIFRLFFRTMRTFQGGLGGGYPLQLGEMFPWGDPMFVRAINMDTYSSVGGGDRLINHIEQAIANRGVAIFATHNVAEGGGAGPQLYANMREAMVYLDANRDKVDVVTYDDLPWDLEQTNSLSGGFLIGGRQK